MIFLGMIGMRTLESPTIDIRINNQSVHQQKTLFVSIHDSVSFTSKEPGYWIQYRPIFKEYNNLSVKLGFICPITYVPEYIQSQGKTNTLDMLSPTPGTKLIAFSPVPISDPITTTHPLHLVQNNVFQLVVREGNTYVGMLTELLGAPFILPPKRLGTFGHQTDLRVGTDCAELAIYGMRRLGHDIPYCGPQGITKYLKPTTDIRKGTLLHFGFQVSVLYKDRGVLGKLDRPDILIHAFEDRVVLQAIGETSLVGKSCRFYRWKHGVR